MISNKVLRCAFGLTLVVLLLVGCVGGPAGPTATPTAIPPTPTLTPVPEMILFLCNMGAGEFLAEEWQGVGQFYIYGSSDAKNFTYPLSGDIQGSSYTFSLMLASADTTTFDASIIVQQGSSETVLASTSFTAKSKKYEQFSATVTGLDPTTAKGDTLIRRISASNAFQGGTPKPGGLAYGGDMASFIKIPLVK